MIDFSGKQLLRFRYPEGTEGLMVAMSADLGDAGRYVTVLVDPCCCGRPHFTFPHWFNPWGATLGDDALDDRVLFEARDYVWWWEIIAGCSVLDEAA